MNDALLDPLLNIVAQDPKLKQTCSEEIEAIRAAISRTCIY